VQNHAGEPGVSCRRHTVGGHTKSDGLLFTRAACSAIVAAAIVHTRHRSYSHHLPWRSLYAGGNVFIAACQRS
jgi:hypothetical protein